LREQWASCSTGRDSPDLHKKTTKRELVVFKVESENDIARAVGELQRWP
jgi:hypothetical protein